MSYFSKTTEKNLDLSSVFTFQNNWKNLDLYLLSKTIEKNLDQIYFP